MISAMEIPKENIVFFPKNGNQMCQDSKVGKNGKYQSIIPFLNLNLNLKE
jgi:hypothetical protein